MPVMDLRVKTVGGIRRVTGHLKMKQRIQHPSVVKETAVREPYWFVRIYEPAVQPDGTFREVRRKRILGPAAGPDAIPKREAERRRDDLLARVRGLTAPEPRTAPPGAPGAARGEGITFAGIAKMWAQATLPNLTPSAAQMHSFACRWLLPRWGGLTLAEIHHHDIQVWVNAALQGLAWHSRKHVVSKLGQMFEYATSCGHNDGRNPTRKINCGRKRSVNSAAVPSKEVIQKVIAATPEKYRLIYVLALANGMRISEVLGLRWRAADWDAGMFSITERFCRGDQGALKTESSERRASMAGLEQTFRRMWAAQGRPGGDAFVFPSSKGGKPLPYYTVYHAFKRATCACGADFRGFALHTLRRANITIRQEEGGATAVEASRMAGHAGLGMTARYTQPSDRRIAETSLRVKDLVLGTGKKRKAAGR